MRRQRRVSLFLGALHADYAALRRYLVDEEFLSRSDGQYWRSGVSAGPLCDTVYASGVTLGVRDG